MAKYVDCHVSRNKKGSAHINIWGCKVSPSSLEKAGHNTGCSRVKVVSETKSTMTVKMPGGEVTLEKE